MPPVPTQPGQTALTILTGAEIVSLASGGPQWAGATTLQIADLAGAFGALVPLAINVNASVASPTVLTPANILGGSVMTVLDMTGAITAATNLQLPTVAAWIAAFPNPPAVGQTYTLRIANTAGSGAGIWTVVTNTGWGTLIGTMTIGVAAYRDFLVEYTGGGGGLFQSIGTGTS